MNKFATLALVLCAYLAVGSCYGIGGGHGGYGHRTLQKSYGVLNNEGSAAAASSSSAGDNNRPIEIIAGGRGGYGRSELLRPVRLDSGYGSIGRGIHGGLIGHGGYGPWEGRRGGYGQTGYGKKRWSVQPAGATLLYPGQNHYRAYVSPPEYSKVVLPIRPAPPVAKLFVPEHSYGHGYGVSGPKY